MAAEPKKGLTDEEANACLTEPSDQTKGFLFQQTMYRIRDPKASLKFYTEILGMRLLAKYDIEPMKFTAYFMGFEAAEDIPEGTEDRLYWSFSRKACLELIHNWGTEDDPSVSYHNGNSDPGKGFGHIGISVPDVFEACKYFESKGVPFIKKPDGGKMAGLAFIKDPDGYWIEILSPNNKVTLN